MPNLEWSNEFSIGVPFFDDEHKELIVMSNALGDAIASGTELPAVRKLEEQLFAHVAEHFRHEEMFFDDYAFAEEHAEQHALLLRRVATYQTTVAADPSIEMCSEMLEFLSGALVRHIAHCDMKLGAHLRAKGGVRMEAGTPLLQSSPGVSKSA